MTPGVSTSTPRPYMERSAGALMQFARLTTPRSRVPWPCSTLYIGYFAAAVYQCRASCMSTDSYASKWIVSTYSNGNSSGKSLLRLVPMLSRHLATFMPRDLASKPHCESSSGRIFGKHVETLTRSENTRSTTARLQHAVVCRPRG